MLSGVYHGANIMTGFVIAYKKINRDKEQLRAGLHVL